MGKSVDEWLNEVDYSFDGYKPSKEALKYVNFMQMASGQELENKTPIVHLKMIDAMFSPGRNSGILCHRGFAKTTVAAEFLILYIAAFGTMPGLGKVKFMIYVGDSIENGVKNLRKNVEYRYQNSEFLQKLIPNINIKYIDEDGGESDQQALGRKFTDVRMEFANYRGDRLVVRMYGSKTGVRGAKELGQRPNLAIIDDIVSDEDARSDTIISTIEDTIHKAVKYALLPNKSKMIWLGTPFNAKDPLYKIIESGAWAVACYPVCEKFPCTKEEFKGSWEERFSYEYVKSAYDEAIAIGNLQSFNQELMLRITSNEDLLVPKSSIIWFDQSSVFSNKDSFNFYITTDLATSSKSTADFSVISVWAYSNNEDWLLIDGWCKKCEVSLFIDKLFELVSAYNPLGVGLEVSGQQKGFISWIQSEMIRRNTFFNLCSSNNSSSPGIRPITDKFSRFVLFVPRFSAKKIWMSKELKDSEWMNEFELEIDKATKNGFKSKHDDILDTISMLGSIEAYRPSQRLRIDKDYSMFYEEEIQSNQSTIF